MGEMFPPLIFAGLFGVFQEAIIVIVYRLSKFRAFRKEMVPENAEGVEKVEKIVPENAELAADVEKMCPENAELAADVEKVCPGNAELVENVGKMALENAEKTYRVSCINQDF